MAAAVTRSQKPFIVDIISGALREGRMARAVRVEGAFYHVPARGDCREAIVREDADRATFVHALGEASAECVSGSRLRADEQPLPSSVGDSAGESFPRAVCAAHNISTATYHAWKKKFGGMEVSEAKRLRALEEENSRLKRLVADQAVQIHILKEVNAKKWRARLQDDGP
jgi:putative transposase